MGRILIVDDEVELAKAYEDCLSIFGMGVVRATDGMEALSKVRNEKFDLIITDINMPKLSGVELIECLRKQDQDRMLKCPIIISSGFIDNSVYEKFKSVGRIQFLPKPVKSAALREKVGEILNKPVKKPALDVRILNPVLKAGLDTLSSMLGGEFKLGSPKIKKQGDVSGDISGIVSLVGAGFRGSVSLSFKEADFLKMVNQLLKIQFTSINEENRDSVATLVSALAEKAKTELKAQGIEVEIAVPSLVTGKDHSVDHRFSSPTVCTTFQNAEFGGCSIEICSVS